MGVTSASAGALSPHDIRRGSARPRTSLSPGSAGAFRAILTLEAMRFPVLKDKPVWPSKPCCPKCGENAVMEPHAMVILGGGAMRVTDLETRSAEMARDCVGFLDLFWHGAHGDGDAAESEGDVSTHLSIAEWTPSGQFEFYFCSTDCLRAFFNACVDALDAKVAKARVRQAQRVKRAARRRRRD